MGAHAAPILGRVSMDLITIDVTDVPERLARRGEWVELIGPKRSGTGACTLCRHDRLRGADQSRPSRV
jgi:alanine racemase